MLQELSKNYIATDVNDIESENDWFSQEDVFSDPEADVDESSNLKIAKGHILLNVAIDSQCGRFSKQNVPCIGERSIFHVI